MHPRTLLVLLAFAAFTSLGLPDGLIGVAWPSISVDFGQPLDALGLLVAVFTTGYLTSSFLAGALLRRFTVGTVLAVSTTAAAVALLGYSVAPAWWLLVGFAFLSGLSGGAVDAGLNAYGATHFTPRTLNWLHAFFGVGTTLGPLIVTAVLGGGLGWHWAYVIVGCAQLALAATFFATRGMWQRVREIGTDNRPPVKAAPALETVRRPIVWLGMLTFFCYSGMEIAAAQWSYSLLTLGRGVDESVAGLYVALYWGSLMAGRILFGFVANRLPLVAALRICVLANIAGTVLVWLEPVPLAAPVGLMIMGAALAPIFATLISQTPERVGRAHADSAIGFQIAAAGLGGAALTALVGVLARGIDLEVIGAALFAIALGLMLIYEVLVRATSRSAD